MKELLEMLVKSIVDEPQKVVVTENEDEEGIVLDVKVAPEDMGRIIGKQGKTANAIRTVVKTKASKDGKKVFVHIVE